MGNKQYEINTNNLSKLDAKLLYVTSANYETDWHSIMHSHPFTELFYVIKGKGRFHVEDNVFDVQEDDLVIVNANVTHTESSNNFHPLEYIVLGIDGISLLTDEIDSPSFYSLHNYENYKHEILFYIKTLLLEASTKSDYYDLMSQDLLELLIINIIRRTKTNLKVSDSKKFNRDCAYIQKYIDSNFSQNITLNDLCDISYMNKFYLVHAFKKYSGKTPIAYLNEKRLQESCMLLKTTDHSISQISSIIGMSSQSYFAQTFKNKFGMSPAEYRKLYHDN